MTYKWISGAMLSGLITASAALAASVPGPLVETQWLANNAAKVFIMDVRANPRSFVEKPVFAKDKKTGKLILLQIGGHIPNAVFVPFKDARTDRTIDGKKVQKMLPEKAQFEKLMQQAGLNQDDAVVLVTEGEGSGDMTIATRMYWQLKYFGHDKVAILNGGMAQWLNEGRNVSVDASKKAAGNWTAKAERRELLATSEDVATAVKDKSAQLVDNREIGQYLGTSKRSYVYAKGHIPGAKMFPHELLVQEDGAAKFHSVKELKDLVKALEVDAGKPAITYCNSGHLASGGWFVLSELMGNKNVKLYDGSMHEWTLEKRPVTTMKVE